VTDDVDAVGGLEVAMDDAHPSRLQGPEDQLGDKGLLDLAEVPRGAAQVEERRQLLRAKARQRAREPLGVAAHHGGWRAQRAGTGGSSSMRRGRANVPKRFSHGRQHRAMATLPGTLALTLRVHSKI